MRYMLLFIFGWLPLLVQGMQTPSHSAYATLDWTVAETLIALEQPPLAMGEVKSYQRWVMKPELPDTLIDLGIRMQPNPEQILALSQILQGKPLSFINSSFYASVTPILESFATVETVDFYRPGNAWQNIIRATYQIARLIGKTENADRLLNRFQQKLAQIRPHLQRFTDRPIILVQFIDIRHLRIYAENSPFGAVLQQLGFHNAWQGEHNDWGFQTIEVTQLAAFPANSRFVVIKPYPADIATALRHNTLWQHLGMAQDPLILPAVWTFGAIPSAQRFAELLAHGLLHGGEAW